MSTYTEVPVTAIPEGAFLLDVRENDEWAAGRSADAHHVILGTLPQKLDELPRDQTIACICRGGGRSAQAAEFLVAQGFTAVNVIGGMNAWAQAALPMVGDGPVPQVI